MRIKYFIVLFVFLISGCIRNSGGDISLSDKEKMTYQVVMSNVSQKNFCLNIDGAHVGKSLSKKILEINKNPSVCNAEHVYSVSLSDFKNIANGNISASYSYYCGDLCSAIYECDFKKISFSSFKLNQCRILVIS